MRKALLVPVMAFILCSMVFPQAFGIRFGMNLEEVRTVATVISRIDDMGYLISPFKKSSYFNKYGVILSKNYGVIAITGWGNTIESDVYGIAIQQEAESLVELLKDAYGEPDFSTNELREGSVWKEPRDWLTSVRKNERVYSFLWGNKLPDYIDMISLTINFKNNYSNECFLYFNCYSSNFERGMKEEMDNNPFQ